ncbi:AAA family ATPase [Brachyspira hyodysenteriae]|uniref:AAA family ATPase n=1 Tax=Brachyspira hyodysenteriae TaxID=159 RepID=UPI001BFC002B|nr:AAA family ATPase [Brachyspira hyodysenteriae]MBT8745244.1 AAA family ATPase [Brachyspira hyodysenteriae]MBT8750425.1 AAA family ATPase [Brachyspira hyodysenteriae]
MKRYLTIKNFRNINPVIVGKEAEYNSEKKEDEVKYGRLYLNGDIEQGALISIIGANGTGKSNILSAIEKSFKGGINGRKDNPKIDGFIGCKPELEIFIEADSGLVYKGKCKTIRIKKTGYSEKDEYKDKLVWELEENKINADIILSKNYLLKILDYIYNATNNVSSKYGSSIYFVYEYNYKYDNKSKTEYAYEDILNYTVSKIMDIISKYKENENIDKLKLLISLLDDESYEQNKNTGYREFNIDENQINKNDVKYLLEILAEIESVNINVYVHRENIKNSELTVGCYASNGHYHDKTRNIITQSHFLRSLFKAADNMEMYNNLIKNYTNILSDVAFAKQTENEINKLFDNTVSKKFNELYKSNNEYKFKIALDEYFIKIYFETKNGITNLENESEGFNWFFSLFFNTINPNELKKGNIIIIDEPEQHLSVPLIKELRKFLKEFAKDNGVTIITSTQIPYFADIHYLDELKIVEPKQDGIGVKIENDFSATYGKVDTLEKIINAFGVKHIDIMRDTKIVYVEGITDYNYLTAFKLLMEHIENREINTAFMPINGVGRPNDERKKNDIIDSLCKLSDKPILLIDSDISADQFTELAEGTNLRITQLEDISSNFVTIEDLFDDNDKQIHKIDKNNKDALDSALFKNNIIDYYEKKLISQSTIDNFFKVIREID